MKNRTLSLRYAKALLELASASNQEKIIGEELGACHQMMQKEKKLSYFFTNPIFTNKEKNAALSTIAGGSRHPLMLQFLTLLMAKKRLPLLPLILDCYHELLNERYGIKEVVITTAHPIRSELKLSLEQILEKRCGTKIVTETKVDKNLLGGMIVQIGHHRFDGSLRTKLNTLKQQMTGSIS